MSEEQGRQGTMQYLRPVRGQLTSNLKSNCNCPHCQWQFIGNLTHLYFIPIFSPLCVYSVLKKPYSFNYTAEIKIKTTKQEKQLLPHVVLWSRLDKACKEQEKQ